MKKKEARDKLTPDLMKHLEKHASNIVGRAMDTPMVGVLVRTAPESVLKHFGLTKQEREKELSAALLGYFSALQILDSILGPRAFASDIVEISDGDRGGTGSSPVAVGSGSYWPLADPQPMMLPRTAAGGAVDTSSAPGPIVPKSWYVPWQVLSEAILKAPIVLEFQQQAAALILVYRIFLTLFLRWLPKVLVWALLWLGLLMLGALVCTLYFFAAHPRETGAWISDGLRAIPSTCFWYLDQLFEEIWAQLLYGRTTVRTQILLPAPVESFTEHGFEGGAHSRSLSAGERARGTDSASPAPFAPIEPQQAPTATAHPPAPTAPAIPLLPPVVTLLVGLLAGNRGLGGHTVER